MAAELHYIEVHRLFIEYSRQGSASNEDLRDLELRENLGVDKRLRWEDLQKFMRLVILAEARAGKSEELRNQRERLVDSHEFAYYTTVQSLHLRGLKAAIHDNRTGGLSAWRAKRGIAHFFIDSVDEARLDGRSFDEALDKIRDELSDDELTRARLVISCRYSDWQLVGDVHALRRLDPDSYYRKVLQKEGDLRPRVMLLCSLDRQQMKRFIGKSELVDGDRFLSELQETGAEALARRPGDLLGLIEYWRREKKIADLPL